MHENDLCEICREIPNDTEIESCDNCNTFHSDCITSASALPACCVNCSSIADCSLISEDLKPAEEEEEDDDDDTSDDSESAAETDDAASGNEEVPARTEAGAE